MEQECKSVLLHSVWENFYFYESNGDDIICPVGGLS